MPIGAREQKLAWTEFGRVVRVDVQHRHRHAAARRGCHEALDLDDRIGAEQSEVGPQRIVERTSIAEP